MNRYISLEILGASHKIWDNDHPVLVSIDVIACDAASASRAKAAKMNFQQNNAVIRCAPLVISFVGSMRRLPTRSFKLCYNTFPTFALDRAENN